MNPKVLVWGVETADAAGMKAAIDAGRVVEINPSSLAKTLCTPNVSLNALKIAQTHLEELLIVSDKEAIESQRFLLERSKVLTELDASCTLAAFESIKERFTRNDHIVLLMCGGNESLDNLLSYCSIIDNPS